MIQGPDWKHRASWLVAAGLALTLIGAGVGAWGVWLSPEQAVEIGQARLSGDTEQDLLKLPAVHNLVHQSQLAAAGFALIAVGTVLQGVGVWLSERHR